ncbi:hypothetical protein CTI12_AA072970 [Artemisia annua]|uniref:Uncharacterized protein n=1 Tax=Artemisia annua TaxID=35608 RepID=A0A2U1Q5H2_ARTAN|nr:hypothetical protein CTI12_AA072970 [Artemisia annua]
MGRTQRCIVFQEGRNKCKESTKQHNREMGPVFRSRFKAFEDEDGEFADALRKEELLDHENCTWLSSSDASSPSSCLQYDGLYGYIDLKIDAWFISLLSTPSPRFSTVLSTEATFFDGSRVNPMEEASLVLHQTKVCDKDMSFDGSSDDHSLFSSTASSYHSSDIVDLEEFGNDQPLFWPSNSAPDWGSRTKCELFIMSPRKDVYKVATSPKNSPLSSSSSSDHVSEAVAIEEDSRTRTPIFLPSSCASQWGSNTKWGLFVMSPRKDIYKIGKSPKTSPDTLRLRVLSRSNTDVEKGCSRRLEFSIKPVATKQKEVDAEAKKSVTKHKIVLLEDLLLVDKLNADGPIEDVLGLCEFDGHEGVESDFNDDKFSLAEIV